MRVMPTYLARTTAFAKGHRLIVFVVALLTLLPTLWMLAPYALQARCERSYPLLNPLRRCNPDLPLKMEFEAFKDALVQRIKDTKELKDIEIALYFRDFQAGPWFGINEDLEFYPASLTKMPTMLALLKIAEEHPSILDQSVGLQNEPQVPRSISAQETSKTLEIGKTYSVEEVLRRSIVYSDNYADFLLRMYMERLTGAPDFLSKAFAELGMVGPGTKEFTLSVKDYSSLFRILYSAQFLNREMSQKALTLLAESDYESGLKAHIPSDVVVAHKFGYYEGGKKHQDKLQLHDCGIVYHPQTPYSICIMTRGKNLGALTAVIADISKLIYDEVDARARPVAE
jgi:beta-lactamase class A